MTVYGLPQILHHLEGNKGKVHIIGTINYGRYERNTENKQPIMMS